MTTVWLLLGAVIAAALVLALVALTRHTRASTTHVTDDDAMRHLAVLRAQRPHVDRLADRLERERASNHFRVRFERALRGQQ